MVTCLRGCINDALPSPVAGGQNVIKSRREDIFKTIVGRLFSEAQVTSDS